MLKYHVIVCQNMCNYHKIYYYYYINYKSNTKQNNVCIADTE